MSIRKESGIKDGSRIVGGESQEGSAKGNEVDVDADALEAKIGIYGEISNEGEAKANKVTINGRTFKPGSPIIGGRVGLSLLDATNNTVTINETAEYLFKEPQIIAGESTKGSAAGNKLNLNEGTFEGPADMFAGKSRDGSTANNIVNLNARGLDLSGIQIWGGFTSDATQDYFTGNTIKISKQVLFITLNF